METVWKFKINPSSEIQTIEMPVWSHILYFGEDPNGELCIWAQVNPVLEYESRSFYCIGTGWDMSEDYMWNWVGTARQGSYMWHLFEVTRYDETPDWAIDIINQSKGEIKFYE